MGVQIVDIKKYIPFFKGAKFHDVYGMEYEIIHRHEYDIEILNKPEYYRNYEYVFTNTQNGKTHHCTQHDLEYKIENKKITFNDKHKSKLDKGLEEEPEPESKYWFVEVREEEDQMQGFYYMDKFFNSKKALDKAGKKNESNLLRVTEIGNYTELKKHQNK